jgi:GH24 family phage-related lysozyme (muramidase)
MHIWHALTSWVGAWLAPIGVVALAIKARSAKAAAPPEASGPSVPPIPSSLPAPPSPEVIEDGLTAQGVAELVHHESICLEAYKDVRKIWTWGVGVTDTSGHNVERYIDHPALLSQCLIIFVWLLRKNYLPDVKKAFAGYALTETQLAAALSFHYNTGAILHATWIDHWKVGDITGAKTSFMQWDHPISVTGRRQDERDLFFDGKWAGDGTAMIYPVLKPSYQPDFHHGTKIYVLASLNEILKGETK